MADETVNVKNGVAEGGEEMESDAIDGNTNKAGTSAGGKKTKKGKNKNKTEAGPATGANLSADQQEKLKKAMEILNLQSQGGAVGQWGRGSGLVLLY